MSAHALSTAPTRVRLLAQMLLLAGAVLLIGAMLPLNSAAAAAPAVVQCSGTDNVGGQSVTCDVTIVNTFDAATGVGSSTVTVRECHGAAGVTGPCTTTTTQHADVTTAVGLCNGSGNGGGGQVTCSVDITNEITGGESPTPATVNQCNGSGAGGGTEPTVSCSPVGNTTDATIEQCNGSGNEGGGTLRVQCEVEPSTQSSALAVTVDQCNGSGNGGGATVTCTASVVNNVLAAPVEPTPSATPSDSPTATTTASASPTASPTSSPTPAPTSPVSPTPTPSDTPAAVIVPEADVPVTVLPVPDGGTPVNAGTPQLPRTGADLGVLWTLGLTLALVGGAMLLLTGRPATAARGRHAYR